MISHEQSAFKPDNTQIMPTIVVGKHKKYTAAQIAAGQLLATVTLQSATKPVLAQVDFTTPVTTYSSGDVFKVGTSANASDIAIVTLTAANPVFRPVSLQFELTATVKLFVTYVPAGSAPANQFASVRILSERF